jgi:DNA-binding LytR/AlgR family response regulator
MHDIEAAVLLRHHDPKVRIVFVTVHTESMVIEATNAPTKDLWSIVVCDPQTRSELQTRSRFLSRTAGATN